MSRETVPGVWDPVFEQKGVVVHQADTGTWVCLNFGSQTSLNAASCIWKKTTEYEVA